MLAENIKKLRKSRGMTQAELASRLNVVRQTVSKWETGASVPDADLLNKLSDILETEVSDLLGKRIDYNNNKNDIDESLKKLTNRQTAIKNKQAHTVWTIIGIAALITMITILVVVIIPSHELEPDHTAQPISDWTNSETPLLNDD